MNANLRNFALWVIIVLLLLALFTLFQNPGAAHQRAGHLVLAAADRGRSGPRARRRDPGSGDPRHLHRRPRLPDLCAERSEPGPAALQQGRRDHGAAAAGQRAVVRVAAGLVAAVHRADRRVDLPVAADAGRGRQGAGLRQVARQASDRGAWPRHLRGRRRRRRGQAGPAGDRRVPARPAANSSASADAFRAACCWSARPAPARR